MRKYKYIENYIKVKHYYKFRPEQFLFHNHTGNYQIL